MKLVVARRCHGYIIHLEEGDHAEEASLMAICATLTMKIECITSALKMRSRG